MIADRRNGSILMGLHHFSSEAGIGRFDPRPVLVPSMRPPGREWLNGPLVWAIETDWRGLYLFPRECPRILLRRRYDTIAEDAGRWFGQSNADMIAYVEARWMDSISTVTLHRYDFPSEGFESLEDAGMWVSRDVVTPIQATPMSDLPAELANAGVELRPVEALTFLRDIWSSSLHASGIRLRNAVGWIKDTTGATS